MNFSVVLPADSELPILRVLGVEFYQEVNGQMYASKNGTYNAQSVVVVDTVYDRPAFKKKLF
jgi:hypothetical protein